MKWYIGQRIVAIKDHSQEVQVVTCLKFPTKTLYKT